MGLAADTADRMRRWRRGETGIPTRWTPTSSIVLFGGQETPEELRKADETELRLKGRARRYDKEDPK